MGCDFYADDDGRFELQLTDADGKQIGFIVIDDLEPGAQIYRDLLVGRVR